MGINDTAQPNADQPTGAENQDRTAGKHDALVNLTQAQLNSILANEIRKVEQRYSDYEAIRAKAARLDDLEAAQLSELERAQQALVAKDAELEAERKATAEARLSALRLTVGQKLGLAPEFSALLQGTDEETITAHAQQLIAAMPSAPPPTIPNINATAGGGQPVNRHGIKLTPEQEQAIINAQKVDPTFTRERYIERLEQFQEKG